MTTLIGLVGVPRGRLWRWACPGSPGPRRGRGGASPPAAALLGAAAVWVVVESGLLAELLDPLPRSTPLHQAESGTPFGITTQTLTIYYPTLWPLVALAVVVGLAYRPRPTAFCACVAAVAFVLHSFAASKAMRYFSYARPFLFVLWGIALAEIWPRLRRFLEDVGTRALAWLRLGRLGRSGVFAVLAVVLLFTVAANGAFVRTAATMFGFVIPPVQRPADWAAAKQTLAPWLADAAIVLTTSELETLYHLGRYDVLISKGRLSEIRGWREFGLDPRTGRPVIADAGVARVADGLLPERLDRRQRRPLAQSRQLDDAVADLIVARAEEVELPAFGMRAYAWRQPDDARRAEACARLPAGMGGEVMAGLERGHAP